MLFGKTKSRNASKSRESKEVNSAHPKNPLTVTAIGDSVMIDITPYLKNTFPDIRIDAQIGRQLSKAIPVVEQLKMKGI